MEREFDIRIRPKNVGVKYFSNFIVVNQIIT